MKTVLLLLLSFLALTAHAGDPVQIAALDEKSQYQQESAELLSYFRNRAIQGDANAQFRVGFAYETGDGLPRDTSKASNWYKRAARQGHKNAIMNLAAMEEKNKPFIDTESEYEKELKASAKEGDIEARNQLARMLVNNVLKAPDHRKIFGWMSEQAQADDGHSQYILGQMYEMGIAVPQNYIHAYAWYSVAAASGDELAILNRDSIAGRMSHEQLEKGQEKSAELFQSYVLNHADDNMDGELAHPEEVTLDQEVVSQLP